MSFESCVREQAGLFKEAYEEDIEEDNLIGGFKVDFVDNIECTLDFIFLFEKLWGSFLVGPFRDIRRFLAILQARAKALLDFGQQSELRRISFDANVKAAKAFADKLKALEQQYRGCPPVQGLILVSTIVSFSYSTMVSIEKAADTFSKKNLNKIRQRETIRLARNEVAKLLADPSPNVTEAAGKILAASALFALGGAVPNKQSTDQIVLSLFFLLLYVGIAGPEGEDDTAETGSDLIQGYLGLLQMINSCLQIEGLDLEDPAVNKELEKVGQSDPEGLKATQNFFDKTLGVPRPDSSAIFNLPPL
jgi:hypothetical protein